MASASENNPIDPVQIDAKTQGDRLVVLTSAEDEDRFVRDCRWVVEASQLGIGRDVWLRELHTLLSRVKQWAQENASMVTRAFATQRDAQIAIFIVPAAGRFDFDLTDKLTELDLELAEKFPVCPCDVLQTPDRPLDEIEHLTDNRLAILIYGDSSRAQSEVAS